ncbi:MAG: ABC transporter permease, partial [Leifsonia sp.]
MRYYLNKLGFYLIAAWIAITLNFLLPRLVKGSPVDVILAKTQGVAPMPPEARHALELQFGVTHDPLIVQYVHYLGNLFTGNVGLSVSYYPTPAIDVVMQALPWTVGLVGLATVISYLIGIVFGSWLGWRRGTWTDAILPASTFFSAIPYFWLALVLVAVFAVHLGWFPIVGGYDVFEFPDGPELSWPFFVSAVQHAILPIITIVLSSIGGWLLGMRNMMVSTLS